MNETLVWLKACLFFHGLYLLLPAVCIFGPIVLVFYFEQYLIGAVALLTYIYLSFDGSEREFGRPWRALTDTDLLMGPIVDYFPMALHREGDAFDASRRYIFCLSPHGTLAFSRGVMAFVRRRFWKRLFAGIETRDLSASAPFYLPLIREVWLGSGCVDASRAVAERILESGQGEEGPLSLALFPGGEAEQLETERDRYRIFIRRRKGFVRLALKYGAPLVPIFTFGETSLYSTSRAFYSIRKWIMQKFRICITLFWGQCFLMPHRVPVNMVVGRPIEVEQCKGEPSRELIDRVHQQYIDAVKDLFERNKVKYGVDSNESLVIM